MKTILAPTDFSAPSESAVRYAATLASRMNAGLCLMHAYQVPVSMNEVPAVTVPVDELRQHADTGLQRIADELRGQHPNLDIRIESRLGDVVEELKDLCQTLKPVLMVTGHHGGSGLERVLFGSTSLSLIHQLNLPLIAVPEGARVHFPSRIALALDRDGTRKGEYIRDFAADLGAELLLMHVQTDEKDVAPNYFDMPVKTVINNKFLHGVEQFIREEAVDLLLVLPRHHSLLEKWFFKTHTPQLINHLHIPVMCVPE